MSHFNGGRAFQPAAEPIKAPATSANGRSRPTEPASVQTIISTGDVILEYDSSGNRSLAARPAIHHWQVSSQDLMQKSPYFRAFLDPNKFSEGRDFMNQKALHNHQSSDGVGSTEDDKTQAHDALPIVHLPVNHFSPSLGLDAIETFLRVLSYDSLDENGRSVLDAELKAQRPSFIARLVELSDAFNSPHVVRAALKRSGYILGKPKLPLTKFVSSMVKIPEDRIRQLIFIACFLDDEFIFQTLTHTLVVTGSKFWTNGLVPPDALPFRWHYFPDGLEEELYYRRQCVLNTITDLQAYFLRIYGALEEPILSKSSIPNPSIAATTIQSRQYQCRCGLGNSSACDAFHLGQMTRFFALRTKTIFLGSTLIDPDFDPDIGFEEHQGEEDSQNHTDGCPHLSQPSAPHSNTQPPAEITAIIASLKQCPDYQIDGNHTGCGIRRRLLPPLDCIEGFVGDERGLLGVKLRQFSCLTAGEGRREGKWSHVGGSWANRSLRRALVIDIRLSRIGGKPLMTPGASVLGSREEDARLLFTAKKRNWEA